MKLILKLPVQCVLLFMLLMYGVNKLLVIGGDVFPYQTASAIVIFVFGLVIIGLGGIAFRKAQTTVNPITPEKSTSLVRGGVYRFSRNPMYIGFFCWLLGFGVYLGNPLNLLLLPVFVLTVNHLYIFPEEQALQKLFPAEFESYKAEVRRWI